VRASSANPGSPATSIILFLECITILVPSANYYMSSPPSCTKTTLQPHFLITAIERKLFSLFSPCFKHIIEMSRLLICNVSRVGRNRAWSGH
jgi:hypothetical protein